MWNCEWITTGWPNIEQYTLKLHQETNFFTNEFAKRSINIDLRIAILSKVSQMVNSLIVYKNIT